jgi:glutathione synthase/RimK-type ligase-like ATP-grasp enzyme
MQKRCAFLTMDDTAGWSIDADLAIAPLQELGWHIDTVPWRSTDADWSTYDAVYVGTPWDYPQDPPLFLDALKRIEKAGALLVNPFALLRWNLNKTYLRDLESRGAAIVPTIWLERLHAVALAGLFERCASERIIIKPTISTNATDTFLLSRVIPAELQKQLLDAFADRACMAQPFIDAIQTDGEFSLFYIGGTFSHAIQKRPKPRDFRVQEEHGASIDAVTPGEALLATATQVISLVEPVPMYARVDLVPDANGRFLLMELELIEPSMYLRMDQAAPGRFATAFDHYVSTRKRDE